jgi:hypothetical protein
MDLFFLYVTEKNQFILFITARLPRITKGTEFFHLQTEKKGQWLRLKSLQKNGIYLSGERSSRECLRLCLGGGGAW